MCTSELVQKKAGTERKPQFKKKKRSGTKTSDFTLSGSPECDLTGPIGHSPSLAHSSSRGETYPLTPTATVYECNFFQPHIEGLAALASSCCGEMLVIAKTDFTIELYEFLGNWVPVSIVFPSSAKTDLSVSSLIFSTCGSYIYASRFDGSLSIYRVSSEGLFLHVTIRPGGGAIWGMALAPDVPTESFCLALACDDGRVRFVSPDPEFSSMHGQILSDESSHYIINVSRRSGGERILCVSWVQAPKGIFPGVVVCGDSKGVLRWISQKDLLSIESARIVSKVRNVVPIWTVQVIGPYVVCGDDRGKVTVWSSVTYSMKADLQVEGFDGPLWCSALSVANSLPTILFGCANGTVGGLRFPDPHLNSWSLLRAYTLFEDDVRGLSFLKDDKFICGSASGRLTRASLRNFSLMFGPRYGPTSLGLFDGIVRQPTILFLSKHNIVVFRTWRDINFWYIAHNKDDPPRLILRMSLKVARGLRAFSVSDDCQYIFVSDAESARLFRIWDGCGHLAQTLSVDKIKEIDIRQKHESVMYGCSDVAFHGMNVMMITRCRTKVVLYNIVNEDLKGFQTADLASEAHAFTKLSVGSEIVAVSDSLGQVYVAKLKRNTSFENVRWKHQVLGGYDEGRFITALALSASGGTLAVACASGQVTCLKVFEENPCARIICEMPSIVICISVPNLEQSVLVTTLESSNVCSCVPSSKVNQKSSNHGEFESFPLCKEGPIWASGLLSGGHVVVCRNMNYGTPSSDRRVVPRKRFGT